MPERVAGGVERLGPHDDGRGRDAEGGGVPSREAGAPPEAQHGDRVDAAAVGDAVLPVAREDEVVGRSARADPTWAASCPKRGAHSPSSPWRCSAIASASSRRTTAMSRVQVAQLRGVHVRHQVPVGAAQRPLPVDRDQLDEAVEPDPLGEPLLRNPYLRRGHKDSLPSGARSKRSDHVSALRRGKTDQIRRESPV